MSWPQQLSFAVLIPCYNEAQTIAAVIADFRQALPAAQIYVYDNNSTDDTVAIARRAGAIVRHERWQGKGNVVRRMFADIEAHMYVLVDGDGTYPASEVHALIERALSEQLDMVTGARVSTDLLAYRTGHQFGNRLFNRIVALLFGMGMKDIFSGYRVLSWRFVKSFPAESMGFETETEMSVHALHLRIPHGELPVPYGVRPEGSTSKLHTYRDGTRILWTIFMLLKEIRPLLFFGVLSLLLAILSLALGYPLVTEYMRTGLVPRFPTAILATGIMMIAVMCMTAGIILDSVGRMRWDAKRLAYLRFPAPGYN